MSVLSPALSLHVPDPAFILSEDGIYLTAINSNDHLTYHIHEALAGRSLHDVLEQEFADWVLVEIRKTLTEGKPRSVEYQLDAIDIVDLAASSGPQGPQWFLGRITPMPAQAGRPRSVLWISRNIQLQKTLQTRFGPDVPLDPLTGALHSDAVASGPLIKRFGIANSDGLGIVALHLTNAQQVSRVHGEQALELLLRQICQVIVLNLAANALPMRLDATTFAVLADFTPHGPRATADDLDRRVRSYAFGSDQGPALLPIIGISWAAFNAGDDLAQAMAAQQPFAVIPDTRPLTAN